MYIAVTGGIGTGKSYVCRLLKEQFGIEVYDCDAAAKRLMNSSKEIQEKFIHLVGPGVYEGGNLKKHVLADFLLASESNKHAVNEIVHPAVARDFEASGLQWLESAILFESRFYERLRFDVIVCVTAPVDVRLHRIMRRDHITEEKAKEWVDIQMPQEDIVRQSNFEIYNDGHRPLLPQLISLLNSIKKQYSDFQ